MNHITTQQDALDNALVPPEKRLKIERCNARIANLHASILDYHQEDQKFRCIQLQARKKKFQVDTEVFHEILQICPKILNQDFIAPPLKEELITFIQELGYSGRCAFLGKQQDLIDSGNNELKSCGFSKKARKYKKVASPSKKLSPIKEAEPVKKGKRVKRPAKKSITAPTASVVIRDTPGVSVLKKKAPAKADRSKGIEILADVSLLEAAQLKEATKRSKKDFHISQASGSGDGTDSESKVPDEQHCKTSSTDEGTDDNDDLNDDDDDDDNANDDDSKGDDDKADIDDDGNSDADDNERTNSDDDDENPSFTIKDYDEEEHDEEYESVDDNENTDDSKQSFTVSSDFANQFLILEKAPPSNHEVASLMNIKMSHEVSSTQIPSPLTEPTTVIPDSSTIASTTVPPTISMISPLP
ncbi:hypothetical protein Tco_1403356 [Tanacetum coccineum]